MKMLVAAVTVTASLVAAAPAFAAGAIAVDTEQGQKSGDEGYGLGWGDSREQAGAAAMRECRKAGNDSCQIVARFDSCGAYASNRTTYGVGWGASQADAEAMALDGCRNCKVVISECE
jgi:hypothetical protein